MIRLPMDATDKESILKARDVIAETEGKLHILVNKSVINNISLYSFHSDLTNSAGQVGPVSRFLNDASAPERKDASTLGQALFDNESFEAWADLYKINTFSIFFVTTAFLGLLDKGSREKDGYTSSVINITSISGIMKLAQRHVRINHHILPLSKMTGSDSSVITAPKAQHLTSQRC
jgi:NAD(P)-dependent dehydrogenase (short-subunit alcohol dehydrogenase family)